MDKEQIKKIMLEILQEELRVSSVKKVPLRDIRLTEADRLDTGHGGDRVFTRDVLSLQESPRMGCGIMVMERTTFPWVLNYDEIDYVIEGTLQIILPDRTVTAEAGELIYLPKGSSIQFSAADAVRFLYVTDPADWKNQK